MIQYTYYSAATELHPDKSGINRITWEDNESTNSSDWTEITREYFLVDPRNKTGIALQSLLSASKEELETIKKYLGINA